MTTTHPALEAAQAELDEAQTAHQALLNTAIAGTTKVKPSDLSSAESRVELAKLRLSGAETEAAEATEAQRLADIDEVLASLTDPKATTDGPAAHAAAIVAALVKVSDGLIELAEAADTYNASVIAAYRRLHGLGKLPDCVRLDSGGWGGVSASIAMGGQRVKTRGLTELLGDATASAAHRRPRDSQILKTYGGASGFEPCEALAAAHGIDNGHTHRPKAIDPIAAKRARRAAKSATA